MNLELKQLEYFLACARLGSLTLAAEELYTTQPHVSMVIRSLENALGVRLFKRKSNGVELTDEGQAAYAYASAAVRNARLLSDIVGGQSSSDLRIASNPSSHMTVLLTDYYILQKDQAYSIRYTECGIEEMLSLVSDGSADLGFLMVPDDRRSALTYLLDRKHLEYVPLLATDLVLYVGEKHPLYGQTSITPRELASLRFVQTEEDFFSVEDLLKELPEYRHLGDAQHQVIRTNSSQMVVRILQNTTLANIGSYWLKDLYRQNDFGRLAILGFEHKISFGYLKHKGLPLPEQADHFLSFLIQALRRDT